VTTLINAPPDGSWIAHSIEFSLDSTVLYIGTIGSGQLLGLPLDEDLNPSGEPTTLATVGSGWHDAVAVDACGMLWIPDYYSSGFYRVDLEAGTVTNAVPTGGVAYGHGAVFELAAAPVTAAPLVGHALGGHRRYRTRGVLRRGGDHQPGASPAPSMANGHRHARVR
jgi:hypothetical protein